MAKRGPKPIRIVLSRHALDQYQSGAIKLVDLAAQVGVSPSTLFRELQRRGIDTSRRKRTWRQLKYRAEEVIALYRQGLSLRLVAARTGLSAEGVRKILLRARVKIRPPEVRCLVRNPDGQPIILKRFALRLRALRVAAGLTQTELADRCGLHKLTVGRLEAGRQEPKWQTLLILAEALGANLHALGAHIPSAQAAGR
jgi:transcriptional regulator with XRE-family HTH domain